MALICCVVCEVDVQYGVVLHGFRGWLLDLPDVKMVNEIAYMKNKVLPYHVCITITFVTADPCLQ